jgi:hypothetical protein
MVDAEALEVGVKIEESKRGVTRMAMFYLTGSDLNGRRQTQAIQAKTIANAHQQLVVRGWTDIVAHTDDVWVLSQRDIPNNPFSPAEMIRFGRMTSFEYLWLIEVLNSGFRSRELDPTAFKVNRRRWQVRKVGIAEAGIGAEKNHCFERRSGRVNQRA